MRGPQCFYYVMSVVRRGLVLVVAALMAGACTSSAPSTKTVTTSSVRAVLQGKVCGVTALAGGPPGAVGVKQPALLHLCETGRHHAENLFVLVSSTGASYEAYGYADMGWTAALPAGTYRASGMPGCTGYGKPFKVVAGKTTLGVVVWYGCDYS